MRRSTKTSRSRRIAAIGAAVLGAAGLMTGVAGIGHADPGGAGCQVDGTATFDPGPGDNAEFGYTLNGDLTGCESNREGAPAAGVIDVGKVVTTTVDYVQDDGTVVQGEATYQAPVATGTGNLPNSCASSQTMGTAIVEWDNGATTVVDYTTQSVASGVELEGVVAESTTLTLVSGDGTPGTPPDSITVSTSPDSVAAVGEGAAGLLRFSPPDPTQCTEPTGVDSAAITGVVAVGSSS